jgi:spore germination cell wall hydrolase CwlJ-like protein
MRQWMWLIAGIAAAALLVLRGPAWFAPPRPRAPRPSLTMAQARESNAAVPIRRAERRSAARFRFRGGPAAREQAMECLATAAVYEAGDDPRGQRAVIQVILNRVRAPGFPRTVCGVVYQGSGRSSGCQFSFTCDGSVQRRPERAGWAMARRSARRALAGQVFADVGRATHYHTDWMVPYWRDSLVKVARVGTHVFYVRG